MMSREAEELEKVRLSSAVVADQTYEAGVRGYLQCQVAEVAELVYLKSGNSHEPYSRGGVGHSR
jgi:hypothetical protein